MSDSQASLFVFDVDGTLLNGDLQILPSTASSVRHLIAKGHHVALASARPPRSVRQLSQQLLGNVTEIISLNGAFITQGSNVLFEHKIRPEHARELIVHGRRLGLAINVLSEWDWLVEDLSAGISAEAKIVGFEPTVVRDLEQAIDRSIHKILFIGRNESVKTLKEWVGSMRLSVAAALSKPTYCEVVAEGTSKAKALTFLANKLGVPLERVVAFGDGENDLPMILAAGIGVAMANGMDAVKEAAQLVTGSNDEDGIASALRKLGYGPEQ